MNLVKEKITNLLEEEILRCKEMFEGKKEIDISKENSPLCKEFKKFCKGCPVYQKTGWKNCAKTPNSRLITHLLFFHFQRTNSSQRVISECPECEKHLRDWIEFLESLLKEKLEKKPSEKTLKERIMMGPFV